MVRYVPLECENKGSSSCDYKVQGIIALRWHFQRIELRRKWDVVFLQPVVKRCKASSGAQPFDDHCPLPLRICASATNSGVWSRVGSPIPGGDLTVQAKLGDECSRKLPRSRCIPILNTTWIAGGLGTGPSTGVHSSPQKEFQGSSSIARKCCSGTNSRQDDFINIPIGRLP